jgi:DNA repair exonuclease SbcCD ATPase subunit
MFKCVHIADVHFRGLKRHQEYKTIFQEFFLKCKDIKPDLIYIGGDIVHSKTQGISPELIDILNWWFTELASISPVHIILGNHDGLILNENRQDAITPIIKALNNDNLYLYKKSGVYPTGIEGFNWCIFSCFDEKGWNNVKPVKDEINIACYHGAVEGSLTDIDWALEGEVDLSFFSGYDFGFLGDIHRYQYLDLEKRVAYPGSTIQQNYGEEVVKGFIVWEINAKNDFTSKFVPLENKMPFITIDWKGSIEDTIEEIKSYPDESRLRIRSDVSISQAEIQLLHETINTIKNPQEIVYKIDDTTSNSLDYKKNIENLFDVYDSNSRYEFLSNLLSEENEENLKRVNNLFEETINKLNFEEKDSHQNKWSINNIKFNNTFSYGKNNFINFNNMQGITGLFGKNRIGKSSIPGTLMYGLFNSTDRGPIKNLHVINNRKGDCSTEIEISVNNDKYIVKRNTKKHQARSGKISATTKLSLDKIDDKGKIVNENEEQRRETEKILKKLIGSSEDFLYTSFASQGGVNTFIKEKNTSRKTIISKFLNLDIYEELWKESRENYTLLKAKLKTFSSADWNTLIEENLQLISENENKITDVNKEIKSKRSLQIEKSLLLEDLKRNIKRHPSGLNFIQAKDMLENSKNLLDSCERNISIKTKALNEKLLKKEKIKAFKINFPLQDLKQEKDRLEILENKLNKVNSNLSFSKKNRTKSESKINILNEVPCGSEFSHCQFIRDAYEEKENVVFINEEIKKLEGSFLEIKSIVEKLKEENIERKLKKYDTVLNTEYKLKVDIENLTREIDFNKRELKKYVSEFGKYDKVIKELKEIEDETFIHEEKSLRELITEIEKSINDLTDKCFDLERTNIKLNSQIENWEKEKNEYSKLVTDWKVYDLFTYCVSKKGIPSKLIDYALPKINSELRNILQGVTGFNVEILSENDNKNLEIYINYGDAKRIIECCSGMEKMMTSLAIRVALSNISNLPKSDIFIIDEGFGTLDSANVEACGIFLQSLKKWFKCILIISHIDEVKDMVDNLLEINIKGKDSYVEFK